MKKLFFIVLCLTLSLLVLSCKDDKEIVVGASPAPHASILNECKEYIEAKGYKLKIVEYSDYVIPNLGVNDGSLDANFFQHQPYLNDFNLNNKTDIVSVCSIHFEPLGLYSGKLSSIDAIKDGQTIGVPNDTTNFARALLLLNSLGLLTVDPSKGVLCTKKDIISNPYNINIIELKAEQITKQLPSLDFAIINGNYAINGGVLDKLIIAEDPKSLSAQTYANILCVKKGNENTEKTKILVEALTQQKISEYIKNNYDGMVVPLF